MFEKLREAAGEGRVKGGYEDKLNEEQRALLPLFEDWLLKEDPNGVKSENTATSYRGYVAQAIVRLEAGETWNDLSTDIRSAVRAFIRFDDAMNPDAAPAVEVDTDPDNEEQ